MLEVTETYFAESKNVVWRSWTHWLTHVQCWDWIHMLQFWNARQFLRHSRAGANDKSCLPRSEGLVSVVTCMYNVWWCMYRCDVERSFICDSVSTTEELLDVVALSVCTCHHIVWLQFFVPRVIMVIVWSWVYSTDNFHAWLGFIMHYEVITFMLMYSVFRVRL
jgi:hypothetical protein